MNPINWKETLLLSRKWTASIGESNRICFFWEMSPMGKEAKLGRVVIGVGVADVPFLPSKKEEQMLSDVVHTY